MNDLVDSSLNIEEFRKQVIAESSDSSSQTWDPSDYDFVQEKILASKKRFWRLTDFPECNPDRTHKAFKKLEKEQEVNRIIRGLYWRGEKDEHNQIIQPTVYQITANVLDLSFGIGYSEKTAFEKLKLQPSKEAKSNWESENCSNLVFVAVPLRAPRRIPGGIVLSRLGAKERINQKLNLAETTFFEALYNWRQLQQNKKNNQRLQELLLLEENEEEVLGFTIQKNKIIKAANTETATVRDSLRSLLFSLDLNDQAEQVMPARKRNSSPGWQADF